MAAFSFQDKINSNSFLEFRKKGLRVNLQNGTVTQQIDVHPVADEASNIMQYFDRDGNLVDELTHPLSRAEKEQAAQRQQMDLFNSDTLKTAASAVNSYAPVQSEPLTNNRIRQDIEDLGEMLGYDPSNLYSSRPQSEVIVPVQSEVTTETVEEKPFTYDPSTEEIGQNLAEALGGRIISSEEDLQSEEVNITYDPTPEQLDDLQRDHDIRNGRPEREQPMSIQDAVQKFTDILNVADETDTSDRFNPADLDQLQEATKVAGQLPTKPGKKRKKQFKPVNSL